LALAAPAVPAHRPVQILAVIALLGSIATLWFTQTGRPPRINSRLHEEVGRALAQESLKLLRPGGHLTVITRDSSTFPQPALDLTLDGLRKELRQAGTAEPTVDTLQVDTLRPVQVPSGDFAEWIRRAAAGDVIVSLLGPPLLTEEQRQALGEIKPGIVALCAGYQPDNSMLRRLSEQRLLQAAVLSRPLASITPVKPARTTGETFDELYQRVRATDLARLPDAGVSP